MSNNLGLFRTFNGGKLTASANTKIDYLVPPVLGKRTKVTEIQVTVGATAHTLTALRPLGHTTLSSAASAAQAVVNMVADPGNFPLGRVNTTGTTGDNSPSSGDYVCYPHTDAGGNVTYVLDTVSSLSTLALTLTNNVPTGGLAAGTDLWFFGVAADTDPRTAAAHPAWTLAASTLVILDDLVETIGAYEPILLQVNNATNASTVEKVSAVYAVA